MTSSPSPYDTLARKAEVEEKLSVAVYMGGGPSLMYSANALAAFAEFAKALETKL